MMKHPVGFKIKGFGVRRLSSHPYLPVTSRMTLGKSLDLSKPRFPCICLAHHKCCVNVAHYLIIQELSQLLYGWKGKDPTSLDGHKRDPKDQPV